MHAHRPSTIPILFAAILLVGVLAAAPGAAAAQNRPTWATGDTWTLSGNEGTATVSMTFAIQERTSITLGARTYGVWHAVQTTTGSFGGGSITVVVEQWIRDEDLGTARTSSQFLFNVTNTYDPPKPAANFPLTVGASWFGNVTETTMTDFGGPTTSTEPYSGRVLSEGNIATAAGTFPAVAIRSPAAGNPYTVSWYSETVGYFVRIENYNGAGAFDGSMDLVSYRYQGAFGLLLLIAGVLVVLGIVAAVALTVLRRRRLPSIGAQQPTQVASPQYQPPLQQYPSPPAPPQPLPEEPPLEPPIDDL